MGQAKVSQVFQLKVALKGIRPPIWRRVLVPSHIKMLQLHDVFQVVFGWENAHLHEFVVGRTHIGMGGDDDWGPAPLDERKVRLDEVARPRSSFLYTYDFGDSWHHEVLVEKALPPEPGGAYPRCVGGKRACPPEDCGGAWGYEDVLAALADPENEEHAERLDWIGGDFDPEAFDLAAANRLLGERYSTTIASTRLG